MTVEEYNKEAEKELKGVPKRYHDGCKRLAYEFGHAYGYPEVLIYLSEITDIFKNT